MLKMSGNSNDLVVIESEQDQAIYNKKKMTKEERERYREELQDFGGYEDK